MMRNVIFTRLALLGLSFLTLSPMPQTVIADEEEAKLEVLTIGSKAPELNVEHWVSDGHGKFKPVSSFENGKVYIVEFWATWCGPCISSMPHIAETQEKFADQGVQVVSISDEDLETVEKFLKRPVRKPVAAAKKAEPKDGEDKEESDEEAKEETYADLTSAYCLTTDPDRSNHTAYMEAAGQRGIPTSFIVGKTGEIEWIGHPMTMDKPLESVLGDSWDREAFLKAGFKKKQDQDILMTRVMKKVRAKDVEGALSLIEKAKEAASDDQQGLAGLVRMEAQIRIMPILEKIRAGENVDEAQAELLELVQNAPKDTASQIRTMAFGAMMSLRKTDVAAGFLNEIASMEKVDAKELNTLAWSVYQQAQRDKNFPAEVLKAAVALAEKATTTEPKNAMFVDTLAHLVHKAGDLDRAIELQTKAVEELGEGNTVNDEMKSFLEQLKKEKEQK